MLRVLCALSGIGALVTGCDIFPDLSGLTPSDEGGVDSGDATTGSDSASDAIADAKPDVEAGDSGDAASCTCTNLVSAYRFADPNNLGHDFIGNNNMTTVVGSPAQSSVTPPGLTGHSIQLDGSSSVCITSGFTFDSTSDHTLCWWARPDALANDTNQFAQQCNYDTWTTSSGADYLWHINNCNSGTSADLQVQNTYSVGTWVQICQTYSKSAMKRTVVLDGQTTSKKFSVTDSVPILEQSSAEWCIGSYGSGGFWTGLIYLPLWFDRILSDPEIQSVHANACCLP